MNRSILWASATLALAFGLAAAPSLAAEAASARYVVKLKAPELGVRPAARPGSGQKPISPTAFAVTATPDQVRAIRADPNVERVWLDIIVSPQTTPQLQQIDVLPEARAMICDKPRAIKCTGAGTTVAVIDNGVDVSNPGLRGKLVAERCFSTTDAASKAQAVCPGGAQQSAARGSSRYFADDSRGYHGTHVSGIAAGNDPGSDFTGVAPDAKLVTIQAFSRFTDPGVCGSSQPCYRAFGSDLTLAFEEVLRINRQRRIAAANLSVGGGLYSGPCDDADPAMTDVLRRLRAAGVAVTVSAGNDGQIGKLVWPACISHVLAVSAVGTRDKAEPLSTFSNYSKQTAYLAPGYDVKSLAPPKWQGIFDDSKLHPSSGTSMAAPFVAGTIALLRQAKPGATVDQIRKALTCAPTLTHAGIKKPRIDADNALRAIMAGGRCPA